MIGMSFEKLHIWKRGMQIAMRVYQISNTLPDRESYGLITQMQRAAVSIPSNIAEGSQRTSQKEFANFVLIAKGSLAELRTQMYLAKALSYAKKEDCDNLIRQIIELDKMLHKFRARLV